MNSRKTLLDLLYEGFDTGEMIDLIEQAGVVIHDRYGRENQTPKDQDLADLKNWVAFHIKMKVERDQPLEWQSNDCQQYWSYNTPPRDYCGEVPPAIDRAWLKNASNDGQTKNTQYKGGKAGAELAKERWDPVEEQKAMAAEHADEFIEKGDLKHNKIADELLKSGLYPKLRRSLMLTVVKSQCYANNRGDLVRGRKTRK
jgi:hypothetical protein